MKYEKEYIQLLDFFVRLVEFNKGTQLGADTSWMESTQPLAAKLLMHLGTLFYLSKGTKLPPLANVDISYNDYSSMVVLARAAYETYLAFNFIFVAPQTIDEKKLRCKIWELGAFRDRQKFSAIVRKNANKLQEEQFVIQKLSQEIISNPVFSRLAAGQQKAAQEGNWRLGYGWVDLAYFAGLDKDKFQSIYCYLCSYAHSGYLPIFQMHPPPASVEKEQLLATWLGVNLGVIAHFIYDYMRVYPNTKPLFDQYPKAKELVCIYDGLGRKSADLNGG